MFGNDCINLLGPLIKECGKSVTIVADSPLKEWSEPVRSSVLDQLRKNGHILAGDIIEGARPNTPYEDVFRIADEIAFRSSDFVISIGGGSTIDATKAAITFKTLRDRFPVLNDYFGVGNISMMLKETARKMIPHVAIQTASSTGSHMTKYSNVTDLQLNQKMLIVDEAIVPAKAVFDYRFSMSQPKELTMDGGLDGISHCLEVLMGIPEEHYEKAKSVCLPGIDLIVNNLKKVIDNPDDMSAREAIGLGTDLGGYAIMVGGTNGAHLNSFSMTDILTHGRACAIMNPYYVVFFSPSIEERLRLVAGIYYDSGYLKENTDKLKGRELGLALAKGMINFSKDIGFPTTLKEVPGFTDEHIARCLTAGKNPKFESKLKNMPVPLSADLVDEFIGPILHAAKTGNMDLIKNIII